MRISVVRGVRASCTWGFKWKIHCANGIEILHWWKKWPLIFTKTQNLSILPFFHRPPHLFGNVVPVYVTLTSVHLLLVEESASVRHQQGLAHILALCSEMKRECELIQHHNFQNKIDLSFCASFEHECRTKRNDANRSRVWHKQNTKEEHGSRAEEMG